MIQIDGDFERSSIDTQLSYVTEDAIGNAIVTLYPRRQTSADWKMRWLEPCFRIKGIKGKTLTIHIFHYGERGDNLCHQEWKENQRGHFSYDFKTWQQLEKLEILPNKLILQHTIPFEKNEIFIAKSWPRSVSMVGQNILTLKNEHPNLIEQTKTAKKFTATKTNGFPAKEFIAGENSPCIDEIGRTIPATPFYSFAINDKSTSIQKKNAFVMGGVHAGEDVGDLALWEFIHWLLSNEPEAIELRTNYLIRVYPMVNAPGRYAGYWRNAPDSPGDTNRQWGFDSPEHECIRIARNIMVDELENDRLIWGFDFHAAPKGENLQIAAKHSIPNSMVLFNEANRFLQNKKFGFYGDPNADLDDAVPPNLTTVWMRKTLEASLSIVIETSDQSGPMSPEIAKPYAIVLGKALHQMHKEGYMQNPQ